MATNRSLSNTNLSNAGYIIGYPLQNNPAPINGQVIEYQNGQWIYATTVPGDINSIANYSGGQGLFAGITGGTAYFFPLVNTDGNILITRSGDMVIINQSFSPTFENITVVANAKFEGVVTFLFEVKDGTMSPGTSGQVLTSTGSGVIWSSPTYTNLEVNDSVTINTTEGLTSQLVLNSQNMGSGLYSSYTLGYYGNTGALSLLPSGTVPSGSTITLQCPSSLILNCANFNLTATTLSSNVNITNNGQLRQNGEFIDSFGSGGTSSQYLSSIGTGVQWVNAPALNFWGLTGNAGTVSGTNYLGTSDNTAFTIATNGNVAGGTRFDVGGQIEQLNTQLSTYLGAGAGASNGGSENTFVGYFAGNALTSGTGNVAIGAFALYAATTVAENIAIGLQAMQNSTGSENIGIGFRAMENSGAGSHNVGIGFLALGTASGTNNTGVGRSSLAAAAGSNNAGLGYLSGTGLATSSNNVAIGQIAGSDSYGGFTTFISNVYNTNLSSSPNNPVVVGIDSNGALGYLELGTSLTTLYNGNGTLNGARTVNQGGYNLEFTGGGNFQINNAAITGSPSTSCNGAVVADTSGNLFNYALTTTWNSMRFAVNVPSMTSVNNIINLYSCMMAGNSTFMMDVYFTLRGTTDASCYHWKVTAGFAGVTTGWHVIPCIQSMSDTATIYVLQGTISTNTLQLRLVRAYWNGTNPGMAANVTIVRREDDSMSNTSTLLSQTPYSDGTINYQIPLQNIQRVSNTNWYGQDITTMGTQTFFWQPGQQIYLSVSVSFDYTTVVATNTISFQFTINGVLNGFAMSSTYSTTGQNFLLSCSNIDLQAGALLLAGNINAVSNTFVPSIVLSGGTFPTANRWYSITITTSF